MTYSKVPIFKVYNLISLGICLYPKTNPTIETLNASWPLKVCACPALWAGDPVSATRVRVPLPALCTRGTRVCVFCDDQNTHCPPNECVEILPYGFVSTSLMKNAVGNLVMDVFATCASALENCLLRSLVHSVIEVWFCFLITAFQGFPYIFWVQAFWLVGDWQIFSPKPYLSFSLPSDTRFLS